MIDAVEFIFFSPKDHKAHLGENIDKVQKLKTY